MKIKKIYRNKIFFCKYLGYNLNFLSLTAVVKIKITVGLSDFFCCVSWTSLLQAIES